MGWTQAYIRKKFLRFLKLIYISGDVISLGIYISHIFKISKKNISSIYLL